jgi:DNA-binding transcriptional LysR family regulator
VDSSGREQTPAEELRQVLAPEWGPEPVKAYDTPLDLPFNRNLEPTVRPRAEDDGEPAHLGLPTLPRLAIGEVATADMYEWMFKDSIAAELLGLSQPAVSRLVDQLERGLALALFARTRNRLSPTPEAELLFGEVERTFASVERIRELAQEIRLARSGRLSIAALPALALSFLPEVMEAFAARHPRTALSIMVQPSAKVEELAASQQIDFGLAEQPFSRAGIEVEEFCRVPLELLVPADHRLAARPCVTPPDLQGERLIALTPNTTGRRLADQALAGAGIEARLVLEVQYAALLATFVARGLGIGLVDPFTAASLPEQEVVRAPFSPALPFHIGLLHPSQRPLSRAARELLTLIRQHRAAVLARSTRRSGAGALSRGQIPSYERVNSSASMLQSFRTCGSSLRASRRLP